MNYERIYNEFIADRRVKEASLTGCTEIHHIIPRGLGGGDNAENMIYLTAGDHFFAHLLLAMAHKGNGPLWRALWCMAGMSNRGIRKRDLRWAIRSRRWFELVRNRYATNSRGAGNNKANMTSYEWIKESTGEFFVGTRHDLVERIGHGKTAKWETGAYFFGRTITTRSGWFETSRFSSVAALDVYKESIKDLAKSGTKAKNSGGMNHKARKVVCIDTGKVYDCQRDAAKATGANQSKISECCTGSRNKAGGYRWAYAAPLKEAA